MSRTRCERVPVPCARSARRCGRGSLPMVIFVDVRVFFRGKGQLFDIMLCYASEGFTLRYGHPYRKAHNSALCHRRKNRCRPLPLKKPRGECQTPIVILTGGTRGEGARPTPACPSDGNYSQRSESRAQKPASLPPWADIVLRAFAPLERLAGRGAGFGSGLQAFGLCFPRSVSSR